MKPTFERCADATLDEVRGIYAERGAQYADTWSPENNARHFTKEAFEMLDGLHKPFDAQDARLLQLAALIDVKISRMTGGFKSDTVVDLIAYLATYKTLREEYQANETERPG